ncbi:MAG: class I SAM-dependent methyltransferase, partial [Solirubrobacterales bacterium]
GGAIELDLKQACAATYEHPAVRWLLGGELHPGGAALTRRAFELIGLGADDRLLDVGSGDGATVLLAAGERRCRAVGLEFGIGAVEAARHAADKERVLDKVEFVAGEASSLPFDDGSFDAVISECSLCLFGDKERAVSEMRRVLCFGGQAALSDAFAEVDSLPEELRGALGAVACVGEALPRGAHRELLEDAGFEVSAEEDRSADAIEMADGIADRLRGMKIAGLDDMLAIDGGVPAALRLVNEAREAIADGRIGYTLVTAR